jgi:hypothetical protein
MDRNFILQIEVVQGILSFEQKHIRSGRITVNFFSKEREPHRFNLMKIGSWQKVHFHPRILISTPDLIFGLAGVCADLIQRRNQ